MKTITTDFEYLAATTVEEALDLLSQHKDDDYRIIAGGQSLNTAMKHRLIAPEYIIDIKDLSDLDYIKFDEKEGLKIGALATHRSLEKSPIVREKYSVLVRDGRECRLSRNAELGHRSRRSLQCRSCCRSCAAAHRIGCKNER